MSITRTSKKLSSSKTIFAKYYDQHADHQTISRLASSPRLHNPAERWWSSGPFSYQPTTRKSTSVNWRFPKTYGEHCVDLGHPKRAKGYLHVQIPERAAAMGPDCLEARMLFRFIIPTTITENPQRIMTDSSIRLKLIYALALSNDKSSAKGHQDDLERWLSPTPFGLCVKPVRFAANEAVQSAPPFIDESVRFNLEVSHHFRSYLQALHQQINVRSIIEVTYLPRLFTEQSSSL